MDGTLTDTATASESGTRSNGNEGVFHLPQIPGLEPEHYK